MTKRLMACVLMLVALTDNAAAQPSDVLALSAADYDRFVKHVTEITEIPAPPFKEAARAAYYADRLREAGLKDVEVDPEGNVMGLRHGTGGGKLLVLAAHLDTVFPEGTPIKVRREGDKLFAPGIGDDSAGLASLLVWLDVMRTNEIRTRDDILFVGTVGEEGAGNLRGVRYLFNKGKYNGRIKAFIAIDGTDVTRIVNTAVGSKRYKINFEGPGGHSYGAFGIVNPMAAAADTISALYRTGVPAKPKTTYAASVISGGTSVNAIPDSVIVEIDLRSSDPNELARLEQRLKAIVEQSVAAENAARSLLTGVVSSTTELTGDRPAGSIADNAPLPALAAATIMKFGLSPRFEASSNDANIPLGLGIPAIGISAGGGGGRTHSLDEYLDIEPEATNKALSIGLDIVLAAAGRVDPASPP